MDGSGRGLICICLEGLSEIQRKPQHKIVDTPDEIRTQHLPNTCQRRYRLCEITVYVDNNAVDLVSLNKLLCVVIAMIITLPQGLIPSCRSGSHYVTVLLTLCVIEGMIDEAVCYVTLRDD